MATIASKCKAAITAEASFCPQRYPHITLADYVWFHTPELPPFTPRRQYFTLYLGPLCVNTLELKGICHAS